MKVTFNEYYKLYLKKKNIEFTSTYEDDEIMMDWIDLCCQQDIKVEIKE